MIQNDHKIFQVRVQRIGTPPDQAPAKVKEQYRVLLSKVKSLHTNLRTEEVEGYCLCLPAVGETFTMFGKPLEIPVGTRVVQTSVVRRVVKAGSEYCFETAHSTYRLKVMEAHDV